MTTQRWTTLVSVLAFSLVLATAGSARAQWGFPGISSQPGVSQFGLGSGSGTAYGSSPSALGSFGATGSGGFGNFVGFPLPGYSQSIGQTPQATFALQPAYDVVTAVPGWSGRSHRVHRRFQAQPGVPRAAMRR
jgi:hypothetical protein